MENSFSNRTRRNISLSFFYLGDHKFVKLENSKNSEEKKEHKRNFFNSPTPKSKSDNNDKIIAPSFN
jgi:hypothetical protein